MFLTAKNWLMDFYDKFYVFWTTEIFKKEHDPEQPVYKNVKGIISHITNSKYSVKEYFYIFVIFAVYNIHIFLDTFSFAAIIFFPISIFIFMMLFAYGGAMGHQVLLMDAVLLIILGCIANHVFTTLMGFVLMLIIYSVYGKRYSRKVKE